MTKTGWWILKCVLHIHVYTYTGLYTSPWAFSDTLESQSTLLWHCAIRCTFCQSECLALSRARFISISSTKRYGGDGRVLCIDCYREMNYLLALPFENGRRRVAWSALLKERDIQQLAETYRYGLQVTSPCGKNQCETDQVPKKIILPHSKTDLTPV